MAEKEIDNTERASAPPQETSEIRRIHRRNGISVVIRARNEEQPLGRLFDILDHQTVKPDQIVVVDNASTDNTRGLALERGAEVVDVPEGEFTYPKSMNLGMAHASEDLVTLMTAHSFPIHDDFLERGAMYFQEPEVAGVYAGTIPRRDTSRTDRFLAPFFELASKRWETRIEDKAYHSIMGATNSMLRREIG